MAACPECGEPPQPSTLEDTVGFRLFTLEDVPLPLPEAAVVPLWVLDPGSAIVNDAHIRILRQVARHRQRELDEHDAAHPSGDTASNGRRHDLVRSARRTQARVADAETRRPYYRPAASD
jgi:hypothetical protein